MLTSGHHHYIKRLSSHIQVWLESHLEHYGVTEIGYSFYDIEQNRYTFVSTNPTWRKQFLEAGLDIEAISLLKQDIFLLSNQSRIKQCYNQLHDEDSCKTLFIFWNKAGFEMFDITTPRELSHYEQRTIQRSLVNLMCDLYLFIQQELSPAIYTEINRLELVKAQHANKQSSDLNKPYQYGLGRFQGDLILTTQEQILIEYLLVYCTQKEIAAHEQCSVYMVKKKLIKIKRKLGNQSMKTSAMMFELKKRGVLSMFSQA